MLTQESLVDVQGNILAPFTKRNQCFLFFSFRQPSAKPWEWLRELDERGTIASTQDVFDDRKPVLGALGLTASGLVRLRPQFAEELAPYGAYWQGALADRMTSDGGVVASAALVGDLAASGPTPVNWVVGGLGTPVDAILTLAADNDLKDVVADEQKWAKGYGLTVLPQLAGLRLLDDNKKAIEHFGFRDGISQPSVQGFPPGAQSDEPRIAPGEFVLGHEGEPGSDLRPDPPELMVNGSFQVFLRLNQDVVGWRTQMADLQASSAMRVDVAAKVIGRTAKGDPLANGGEGGSLNDFTYEDDPLGEKTPRFAHIRKMYPRSDAPSNATSHRLLRRGITFGPPLDEDAEAERGLLFNGFMASIEDQFEFLMRNWASSPDSLPVAKGASDGPDPLVGTAVPRCTLRQANRSPVVIEFGQFVRTTAAVYAFAPSMSTLRRLGALGAD